MSCVKTPAIAYAPVFYHPINNMIMNKAILILALLAGAILLVVLS
jgi:hypothetical protein